MTSVSLNLNIMCPQCRLSGKDVVVVKMYSALPQDEEPLLTKIEVIRTLSPSLPNSKLATIRSSRTINISVDTNM